MKPDPVIVTTVATIGLVIGGLLSWTMFRLDRWLQEQDD